MGTRSRIGLQLEGQIISAYHHWDGYPEWLGVTLNKKFNTRELVEELIDGGDMSCCDSDSDWDLKECESHVQYYSLRGCLLYTSPSPRDGLLSRMPSSA